VSHPNFVAHQAYSFWKSVNWCHWSYRVVFVNIVFKWAEGLRLICDAILLWVQNLFVVKPVLNGKNLISGTSLDQFGYRKRFVCVSRRGKSENLRAEEHPLEMRSI
jgi:hypothetical protein